VRLRLRLRLRLERSHSKRKSIIPPVYITKNLSARRFAPRRSFASFLLTYFFLMLMASLAAVGAANTLKGVCNTWYHADAKYVPSILFGLTFGVPVLILGGRKLFCKKEGKTTEEIEQENVELVSVNSPSSKNDGAKAGPSSVVSRFPKFVKVKILTTLNILIVISFASLCWSLVATTPAVYTNFNNRMWGFASNEGKR